MPAPSSAAAVDAANQETDQLLFPASQGKSARGESPGAPRQRCGFVVWARAMISEFGFYYLGAIVLVYFLQGAKVGFVYLATGAQRGASPREIERPVPCVHSPPELHGQLG